MTDMQERDQILDLPDDGSRQKETYARFGLATYYAQVFETGMANLIVVSTGIAMFERQQVSVQDVDDLYSDLYSRTAGQLLNRLVGHADPESLSLCKAAVAERNRLAHHYFRDHAQDAMTNAGMQRMLDDADQARGLFIEADRATTAIAHELMKRVGLDEDRVKAEYDALLAGAQLGDGEAPD